MARGENKNSLKNMNVEKGVSARAYYAGLEKAKKEGDLEDVGVYILETLARSKDKTNRYKAAMALLKYSEASKKNESERMCPIVCELVDKVNAIMLSKGVSGIEAIRGMS